MIDVEANYLDEIKTILAKHLPDCEVRAFGSRVSGRPEKFSDLDLALVGSEKIDWRKIEALKDDFAESNLPMMIDVLDWRAMSEEFRRAIADQFVVIQSRESE